MYKRTGIALVLAVLMVLAGILAPSHPALAATTRDPNVSLTITSDPDATGVNVVVFVTSRLDPAKGQTLGFDLSISTPGDSKFLRSWAGNPNANPGVFTGTEVKWSGSVQNGQTQGPYVARFSGNVPFALHAYVQYYGPVNGNLRSNQLITGGLNGLTVAPYGDNPYLGAELLFVSTISMKGIVDTASACGCSSAGFVLYVDPFSPAAVGGLKQGDLLLSINGKATHDIDDYNRIFTPFKLGDTSTFVVQRGAVKQTLTISLTTPYTQAYGKQFIDQFDLQFKNEPHNPRLLLTDAMLFNNDGLYQDAINSINVLLKVAPDAAEAYVIRGEAYENMAEEEKDKQKAANDRQKAIPDLMKAAQLDPASFSAVYILGLAYYNMGDYTNAETHLMLSLKSNPTLSRTNLLLGRIVLHQKKDATGSMKYFDQAVKSNPYSARAYYERGLANAAIGNIDAAKQDYALAIYYDNNGSISGPALAAYRSIANK